jgi:hypothetical protein
LPYAFTEQGVAMLSSVLRSQRAVQVNIAIMRTFVQLRRLMDTNRDLACKIEALEKKYDEAICGGLRSDQRRRRRTSEDVLNREASPDRKGSLLTCRRCAVSTIHDSPFSAVL